MRNEDAANDTFKFVRDAIDNRLFLIATVASFAIEQSKLVMLSRATIVSLRKSVDFRDLCGNNTSRHAVTQVVSQ